KIYKDTENGNIKITGNNILNLIKLRPNPYMTATTFWSTIERNRNHYGNAYAYCRYKGTELLDLWIMQSNNVRVVVDNQGYFGKKNKIWYIYNDTKTGKEYTIDADNVLHFKTSH
ncbi:phage portal protein, partial [Clostridioides difficile]|uniref:phage portal protein n=5 Tax=Peptostreptococcaceae TaxID=186804 RepID=UPI001C67AAA5